MLSFESHYVTQILILEIFLSISRSFSVIFFKWFLLFLLEQKDPVAVCYAILVVVDASVVTEALFYSNLTGDYVIHGNFSFQELSCIL